MTKQIVIIGDSHARPIAIEIIELHLKSAHKIILLGDYVDPYILSPISDKKVVSHLKKIIKYKKDYPDKFVLLIGNHDIHYVHPSIRCSRYNYKIATELRELYTENWDLFDISHQIENYLFTHAGVCMKWLDKHWSHFESFGLKPDYSNIDQVLKDVHKSKLFYILHEVGSFRSNPEEYPKVSGAVTWCDKSEGKNDYIPGFHQYVGHSQGGILETFGDDESSITYCDTLGLSGEYVVLKLKDDESI